MSDNFSQKISELKASTGPSENAYFPLSEINSELSEKVSVTTLRETIGFENAFPTIAIALLATKESDVFFVYEDDKKENVLGYVNQGNGSYSALMTDSNVQLRYATSSFVVNSLFFLRGAKSFEELRTIKPWYEGQRIKLKSYYVDGLTGGGEFIGRLTGGVDDGGVIAAGDGFYWERTLISNNISCFDYGLIPSTENLDEINHALLSLGSYKPTKGKITIDFHRLEFKTNKEKTLLIDPTLVHVKNLTINNTVTSTLNSFAVVTVSPTLSFQSGAQNTIAPIDNLVIKNETRRTSSNVTGLFLDSPVNGAFSSVIFNGLTIMSPKNGISFGNHCYLVKFYDAMITASNDLIDGISAGLLTGSIVDSGENYTFTNAIFGGDQIFNWATFGAEFNFIGVSADFVRLGINAVSGFVLNFLSGHVEFNNDYSRWFESSKVAYINFAPSWVVCGSGTTNYMFFDSSSDLNSLKVRLNVLYWSGRAVNSIINTRLIEDKCDSIQGLMPAIRGDRNRFITDGAFTQSTLVDHWYCDRSVTRTSRLVSDSTTLTKDTVTDSTNTVVGCLNITKSSTIGTGFPAGAFLLIRVPRGVTPPHVKFKIYSPTDTTINVTTSIATVLNVDSNSIPTFGNRVIVSANQTLVASTTETIYQSSSGLFVDSSYQPYDYVLVSISLFAAPQNAVVKIYDVLVNKIG